MTYSITDASNRNLEALEELEQCCFSLPWTREMLESQLPDENHVFIVAVGESGELMGYVGMMTVLDEGYISNVAVSPAWRRQGVADSLIGELLTRAQERDLAFVTLEVRESNEPAISLYRKHGFLPVGLRRNYYEAPKENAIIMTTYLK